MRSLKSAAAEWQPHNKTPLTHPRNDKTKICLTP
jgi:hypothetical protein